MSKTAAIKAITVILSGYPTAEMADREAFTKIAVNALEGYSDDLLGYLANPVHGIIRKSKFIPTVAEMASYMDREGDRRWKEAQRVVQDQQRALAAPEPIVSEETRMAVLNGLRNLSARIKETSGDPEKIGSEKTESERKAEAEEWLTHELNHRRPLPKLSAAALRRG